MRVSQYINMTPHAIKLNCGVIFPPSGKVVRVSDEYNLEDNIWLFDDDDPDYREYDLPYFTINSSLSITDLPPQRSGIRYIVSSAVLKAIKDNNIQRYDFAAPATGHTECIRDINGQIISVPGLVINEY